MDSKEAYEAGSEALAELWGRASEEHSDLPVDLRSKIAHALGEDSQVSQKYSLITQLLLKRVTNVEDSRMIAGVGADFGARAFAKKTVVEFQPLNRRLGNSDDPYVSNPLRADRLEDSLSSARGGDRWSALLDVLDAVDTNPSILEAALIHALKIVREYPEADPVKKVNPKPPKVSANLSILGEQAGLDDNLLMDILEVLESDQPQIILAGPPGTSKTHTAQALAGYLTNADDSRITTVQLHATYGYEDFVEGLRPVASSTGTLTFGVKKGVLRRIADTMADKELPERHVLILDEMNRANLPRVLGELLFAIERRGERVDLLYTTDFKLPAEICFIGTMNTADRSIRSIDAAIRRRFMVFELAPSAEILEAFYLTRDNEVSDLLEGFRKLNEELTLLLDRHHTIGHTYLMDERGMTTGRLGQVWLRQIRPLIEEYLFDMPDELSRFTLAAFWPSALT